MERNMLKRIGTYGVIVCALVWAVLIAFVPDFSAWFLALLLLNLIVVVMDKKQFEASTGAVARVLVGCVFLFSGYVKGVDPLGTQFVIHDYLEAYRLPWLIDLALPLSFLLNMVEFCVGFMLVFNLHTKWVSFLAALMMLCFTGMTFYDALANPVPDCGCFGEAVKLTNWQTFYKNLVLDALVLVLLFSLPKMKKGLPCAMQTMLMALMMLVFLGFEYYNYRHLPISNFLGWKDNRRMLIENPQPVRYYLTYKNNETGEEKEYYDKDIPFSDTAWTNHWTFVSRRDEDPNPRLVQVTLMSRVDDEDEGYDMTDAVIGQEGYHFMVVVYNWEKADEDLIHQLHEKLYKAHEAGVMCDWLVATSSHTPVSDMEAFKQKAGDLDLTYYFSDDTGLKSMIRANPGVILMNGPVVVKRWNGRDFPDIEQIEELKTDMK